jgi:hypothetical protein
MKAALGLRADFFLAGFMDLDDFFLVGIGEHCGLSKTDNAIHFLP